MKFKNAVVVILYVLRDRQGRNYGVDYDNDVFLREFRTGDGVERCKSSVCLQVVLLRVGEHNDLFGAFETR